jgi:hypothetical protein
LTAAFIVVRVGAPFMPVPFTRSLASAYLPDAARIAAAALPGSCARAARWPPTRR